MRRVDALCDVCTSCTDNSVAATWPVSALFSSPPPSSSFSSSTSRLVTAGAASALRGQARRAVDHVLQGPVRQQPGVQGYDEPCELVCQVLCQRIGVDLGWRPDLECKIGTAGNCAIAEPERVHLCLIARCMAMYSNARVSLKPDLESAV